MALTFNANRSQKTKPARIEDFHPYRRRTRRGMKRGDVKGMRSTIEAIARAMR